MAAELAVFVLPQRKNIHNQSFGGCDNLRYFVIMENGNEYDGSKGLILAKMSLEAVRIFM